MSFVRPEPPYTVVVFVSQHSADTEGYEETSARMNQLAAEQPGYLGIESARSPDGFGITVAYWTDEESARAWKRVTEHREAQRRGRAQWYDGYRLHVATVTRTYGTDDRRDVTSDTGAAQVGQD